MRDELVLSVSELNEYARKLLAGDPLLRRVRVRGEVSGFKRHFSGHLYFAIKDAGSRVQCVMFRQNALSLTFAPRDGMQVIIDGSASIFARDGSFQIYAERMDADGTGDLYRRFEELKAKLLAEGLFDAAIKRFIPYLPRRVGVVTSRSGAVFHDIVKVVSRRYPKMPVLLCPVAVQGEGAAQEIAKGIKALSDSNLADVILVGRGGGSMEDLWPFNEEIVARAIRASAVPVISCVGHEVDFTIADFAADVRAATPSVAAELAVPVYAEVCASVAALSRRSALSLGAKITRERARIQRLESSPAMRNFREFTFGRRREALSSIASRLDVSLKKKTGADRTRMEVLSARLTGMNPSAVLRRGYALIRRGQDLLMDARVVSPGDRIEAVMRDGEIRALVESVDGGK